MRIFHLPALILFICSSLLIGCGQKGPLYLPEKQSAPKIEAEAPTSKANKEVNKTSKDDADKSILPNSPSSVTTDGVNK